MWGGFLSHKETIELQVTDKVLKPANAISIAGNKELSFDSSTSKQIYEFLQDHIIGMKLLPGQLISETALAQEFGVSRTPVRQALVQLSTKGFVEVRPQRGTYVTKLSMSKIYEAQFIREALEVAIVRKLCLLEKIPREEIVSLCESIINQQEEMAAIDDAEKFQMLDDQFHQALAIYSGHVHTARLIEAEKSHMDRVRNLSLHVQGQYRRIMNQHLSIIHAIKSGSPDTAADSMSAHLQDVFSMLELISKKYPEYFN